MWNSSTSLKTTRAVRNDECRSQRGVFLLPCASEPASRFHHRRAARLRRPQIHVFLAMLPCPSKRAIPGSSKTNRRAHTPSIKTEVMDLLTELASSACRDADGSTHPPHLTTSSTMSSVLCHE